MGINKDLNISPYFDDFDEDKNYHRVLFKPAVAVQARELTQLQTILQNQIERFGENVIREGSIVKGGNFRDIRKLPYVKVRDNNTNNQPIVIENYIGSTVVGQSTGITATIVTSLPGLESQSPNLNTLYLKYTSSSQDAFGNDIKEFLPGEILEFSVGGVIQPNLSVSIASISVDPAPIGAGYAVRCGDGIIYQKGHFIRFEDQITVVSKYDTAPTGVLVGFQTSEILITSSEDTSLLDNASGFNNEAAPGADRLQLTPVLVTLDEVQAEADETFFAIQEYQNGRLIRRNVTTQFNAINDLIEKRTVEESGNYTLGSYSIQIGDAKSSNGDIDANNLSAFIGPGVSYVEGRRVETVGALEVLIPKATDFNSVEQQDIVANYGNYIRVEDMRGFIDSTDYPRISLYNAEQTSATVGAGFSLQGTKIGETYVRCVVRESSGIYRIYIFDTKMNSGQVFSSTRSFVFNTNISHGNLILENGNAVIKDTSFNSLVFPIGKSSIKSVESINTDYIYRTVISSTANTSGGFSISLTNGDVFPYGASATLNSDQRSNIIVSFNANGAISDVLSATTSSDGTVLEGSIGGTLDPSTPINITYDAKKNDVKPIGKILETVYMRINASANTSGPYNLGFPDVYSVEGVWKGSNTTFDELSPGITDVTDSFKLSKNISLRKYDISFINKKSGLTITSADRFLVKLKVFRKSTSGQFDQSFFTINSYPIDDISSTLPADKIRTESVESVLRNSIDFRPYVANSAVYSTTAAGATIWTNTSKLFSLNFEDINHRLITPNESVEAAYSYYLGRKDRLVINEKGDFVNITGVSSEEPTPPNPPQRGMSLAVINVPPFPSLTSIRANRSGNPSYGVSINREDNQRYTMRDIGRIQKRIERMEYYTVLNALEKSAEDLVVVGADGLNRFKNGILVDSFENLLIGDSKNDDFSASVDPAYKELSPSFRAYNIPLKVNTRTNTVDSGEVITLPYSQEVMIRQPYATTVRNCVTDFYRYSGIATIEPEYDGAPDYTRAPDINFDIDLVSPLAEFTEKLSEFVPLQTVDTTVARNVVATGNSRQLINSESAGWNTVLDTFTTGNDLVTTTTKRTKSLVVAEGGTTTKKIGDFVTDVQFNPYLRSRKINISVSGMRPNTRVYFFFDSVNVDQYVAPGKINDSPSGINSSIRRIAARGTPVRSNNLGEVFAVFDIPPETFFVGDREILVTDVPRTEDIEAATTSAVATYRGFNFSVERTGLEVSTRTPNIANSETVRRKVERTPETDTVLRTINPPPVNTFLPGGRDAGGGDGGGDPIAQTFTVESDYSSDNAVLVTSMDVFFEKKSSTAGITLQLREVVNGFPGPKILTFGSKRLPSNQINVSNNASTATRFTFTAPVTMSVGKEYCLVLIPDGNNPDYRVWVSKTGSTDVLTGVRITQDTNAGLLFTSTNNKAWTPYQDENMKFTLNKALFSASSGTVTLVPRDVEFFSLSSISGDFNSGEEVFVENASGAGSVTLEKDSDTVIGIGTSFSSYFTVGDKVGFEIDTNTFEIAEVVNIANNTSMSISPAPNLIGVTDPLTTSNYFRTVTGELDYINTRAPSRMFLENSSAKTGSVFAPGDVLRNEAGSIAVIDEVLDLPVSHFQANVYRANFTRTSTDLSATSLYNGSSNYVQGQPKNLAFNNNNYLTVDTKIRSRSNEIASASSRSFELSVRLRNTSNDKLRDTSPIIDYPISSITAYEYFINTSNTEIITSESFSDGLALSKYISKGVELADGLDAEDLKVWLTAYRPVGSNIDVYAKFIADNDVIPPEAIIWTKLKLKQGSSFSSEANRFDFRELEYSIDNIVLGNGEGAYIDGSGNFVYTTPGGAVFNNFKIFSVKIVLTSSGQNRIPRVKDMRAIALT